ncbi:MAG: 16S rRNA (cytidine(1402)-2'-O)-methyltransferase [Actinobacteria bacterium]|nr:16S rRNA (cytidine(1402)-2'-O)-methyltransferase [Actinomycetota bacterium]
MKGTLILCATPIGNLEDVSARLRSTLEEADVVFAEDTRRTGKLMERLGIRAELRSFFVGNEQQRLGELRERLRRGETVALVSDAGMPAVSDPGVGAVRLANEVGATVSVVPGPSAVTSALAVAGLGGDRFVFEGFLPRGAGERVRRMEAIAADDRPTVLFSPPTRVAQDLAELADRVGAGRPVVIARELTKLHEEVWRGTLGDAASHWTTDVQPRGEFTLVIAPAVHTAPDMAGALASVDERVAAGVRLSEAVREVAETTSVSRRILYEAALEAQGVREGE